MIAFLAYCVITLPVLFAIFGWQQMAVGNILASVLLWVFAAALLSWLLKLLSAVNK